MSDAFANSADAPFAPATDAVPVIPNDQAALPRIPKALYVGTGGNLTLRGTRGSADAVLKNVPDGQVLPIRASHVRATGTTAADILALY